MKLFLGIQSVFLSILLRESSGKKVERKSLSYDFDLSGGSDRNTRPRALYIQRRKHRSKKKLFRREGSELNDPETFNNMSINENMMVDMPSNMFLNMPANLPANMMGQSQLQNMAYYPAASVSILNEEAPNSLENLNGIPSQLMRWPNPGPIPPPWPGIGWPGSVFPFGSQFGIPPGIAPFGPPGVPPGFPPVVPPGVPPWSPYGMPSPQFPPGWPPGFGWTPLPFNLKPEDFLPDGTNIEDLLKNFEIFWPGLNPNGNQTSSTSQTSLRSKSDQGNENITTHVTQESSAGRAGLQSKMTSPISDIIDVSAKYSPDTSTTMFQESTTRQTMHQIAIRDDYRGVRIDNGRQVRIVNNRESERQRSPTEGPEQGANNEPGSLLFEELISTVSSRPPTFDNEDFDHAQMIDNALGIDGPLDNDRYGIVDRVPHAHLRPTQTVISYKPQTKSSNVHVMPKYGIVQRTHFYPNALLYENL